MSRPLASILHQPDACAFSEGAGVQLEPRATLRDEEWQALLA